jgi:hypothetical protein
MGWVRIGAADGETIYDSREDDLSESDADYIAQLKNFTNKQTDPAVKKHAEELTEAALARIEQEKFERELGVDFYD